MNTFITDELIKSLIEKYGSPLYIYSEKIIKDNIRELKGLCSLPNMRINYAVKANNNPYILNIILKNNMKVDSTGLGEVYINRKVGFPDNMIYVVGNNFTRRELKQLTAMNLQISIDSIDQLMMIGEIAPGYQNLMIRVNPNFGAGENQNVITGGSKTKFGIDYNQFARCIEILEKYKLKLIGINQHIGSSYLQAESLLKGVSTLLKFIKSNNLNDLEIINFGGGFGFNYKHQLNKESMDFAYIRRELKEQFTEFLQDYGNKEVSFEFEPGRYVVANSGILVGEVTSLKERDNHLYVGTNVGFNNLIRPTLYNSYHHISFITNNKIEREISVVGNMCESGDYLCKNRNIVAPELDDVIIVHDVGAYGYVMSSNFNSRLKPIELMIANNQVQLIRPIQTNEQL